MKRIALSVAALAASATTALAGSDDFLTTQVPEISALEGTAALAAVAAIVLLAWERRARA